MKTTSKIIINALIVLINSNYLFAQNSNIFIPIEFIKAVNKESRSMNGTPGAKCFQNYSDYQIQADFNPLTNELIGTENIVYHNNSQDSLKYIVVRLYQNLYKKGASRQVEIEPSDLTDGVDLQKILINNILVDVSKIKYIGTNIILPMKSALPPKSKVEIAINWKVNLPNKTLIRMGRYDSTTCFVAYWYPQISVYDDISGWSLESYTGLQEFYNDFSNFDVEITVPKDFIVWATAILQNNQEIFSDEINNRITNAKNSDKVIDIITENDYKNKTIFKNDKSYQWHFKSENISDFAFAVSNHYLWQGIGAQADSINKRNVLMSSIYKIGSTTYQDIPIIGKYTIEKLSNSIVGIPYPYPQMTVFEGDFGMEFPMMCNDGPCEDYLTKVFVTSHEIFHSYFPFMVGTNETMYAWIDEGLATFIPKIIEQDYGNKNAHYYINSYSKRAMGSIYDIPLLVPSTNLNESTYMMQNYGRAAVGFYFLNDMIGSDLFKKSIQDYINNWKSKHPTPTDLLLTFNRVCKKDISWFWNAWFYQYGYADLALEQVNINDKYVKLVVKKKGSLPVPIKMTISFIDGTSETIYNTAIVWEKSDIWKYENKFAKTIIGIKMGDKDIPDAFTLDNKYSIEN